VTLFNVYRAPALVVGVLLAFCALVAMPLKYLTTDGSSLQQFGEAASIMWLFHGWIFMVYVVVAFLLARRARTDHSVCRSPRGRRARGGDRPIHKRVGEARISGQASEDFRILGERRIVGDIEQPRG